MTIREHIADATEDDIRHAIADAIGIPRGDVLYWTTFAELQLDSLDSKQLLFDLENKFNIDIDDGDWEKCRAVGDCVRLIQAQKPLEVLECVD